MRSVKRSFPVPADVVMDFARDGAVVIRGALIADEVALLTKGIETNLAHPSPLAAVASNADDPGRFFEDFCNWQRIAEYEHTLRESALPTIAAALMKSATARIYHDHLLVKEAVRGSLRLAIRISRTTTLRVVTT